MDKKLTRAAITAVYVRTVRAAARAFEHEPRGLLATCQEAADEAAYTAAYRAVDQIVDGPTWPGWAYRLFRQAVYAAHWPVGGTVSLPSRPLTKRVKRIVYDEWYHSS